MNVRVILFVVGVVVFSASGLAFAGENPDVRAWLSWDFESTVTDLDTMPTGKTGVYVKLDSLSAIFGAEIKMAWRPCCSSLWADTGCYCSEIAPYHPSAAGSDCGWVMRGYQLETPVAPNECDFIFGFGSDEANTVCTSGNLARYDFYFDTCSGDIPGRFALCSVRIDDSQGYSDFATIIGDAAILGGEGVGDPCKDPSALEKSNTWGRIKAIYR